MKLQRFLQRSLLPVLVLGVPLSGTALATWSLVAIDHATGEVAVASATCLANFNLKRFLPVISVGKGAGAAQSFIDTSGQNRVRMFAGFNEGRTPAEILAELEATDSSHQTRQYGIASFDGPPVTFTGTGAGQARAGVVGQVGSIEYAIQGNVLTGTQVVDAAEAAFVGTSGDLGQRLMAGMEAARALGGDGRCSCSGSDPDGCPVPPPGFTKSAHTAFIVVARIGDLEGGCDNTDGCASGEYYLDRRSIGGAAAPDPVLEMQQRYDVWRMNMLGKPDQLLTRVQPSAQRLVADGSSSLEVLLELRDVDDVPLTVGGQVVSVRRLPGAPDVASVSPVTDHGDGTHSFTLTSSGQVGLGGWRIVVEQGNKRTTLHPPLEIPIDPVTPLHIGFDQVSTSEGAQVPFAINAGPAEAGRSYILLGSASGTVPGTPFGGQTLPLNADRLLRFTFGSPGPPLFSGSAGQLDAAGHASASLRATPGALAALPGRWDFVGVLFGNPDDFTNGVGFDVVP